MEYDKLGQLHYLDLCIQETLRLYPSVTRFVYLLNSDRHSIKYSDCFLNCILAKLFFEWVFM